jgi:hypothetical protein
MRLSIRRSTWLLLLCGSIATLSASPPVIGVARSRGAFMINNASVPGTATILDGTSVRTMALSSDVRLKTGERLTLGSGSAATIYQDRLVLQSGIAEVDRVSAYHVEAGDLRIGASNSGASVRVAVSGSQQVQVAAMAGTAEVRNAKGVLVARIPPGMALQLQTTGGNSSTELTGVITSEHGKYFLTDETTKVKVELRGNNLKELVGKRARVKGSTVPAATAGDAAVVTVASATVIGAAAAAGGAAAAGAGTGAGLSATTIGVIIVGGAAAGTLGGLAAAGTFSGSDATISR